MVSDSRNLDHVRFEGVAVPPSRCRKGPASPTAAASLPSRASEPAHGFPSEVLARAGLMPHAYRHAPLERRTAACLRALRCTSEEEALSLVEREPRMLAVALDALLIGVTEFQRDAGVFEAIRAQVIPVLGQRPAPRVWSVGCSTGAELLSVAWLLAEVGALDRAELLGTDCRKAPIETARAALYPATALARLDPRLRDAWFEPEPGGWRAVARLRAATRWRCSDVLRETQPGPWDMILWRNAAIYLQPDAASEVSARLLAALAPGGFLVLGRAERLPGGAVVRPISRCVSRKLGE